MMRRSITMYLLSIKFDNILIIIHNYIVCIAANLAWRVRGGA